MHGLQAERRTALREPAPHSPNALALRWLARIALLVFICDFGSKSLAIRTLSGSPKRIIGSFLELELTSNSGAAFSLATSATLFLSLLSIGAIAAIYIFVKSITSRAWAIALGFLLGGICGNLSDRIFRSPYWLKGAVTDWIKLPHWPVFNLADTSIVISAATIGLLLIKNVKPRVFNDAS